MFQDIPKLTVFSCVKQRLTEVGEGAPLKEGAEGF